jgi:hypothetical protein
MLDKGYVTKFLHSTARIFCYQYKSFNNDAGNSSNSQAKIAAIFYSDTVLGDFVDSF